MATASPSISFMVLFSFHLILCLLFCSENTCAHEGEVREETMESHKQHHSHVIKISDLFPAPVCSTSTSNPKGTNAKTFLEVVHKHGPCSKLGPKLEAKPPTPTQILLEDQSRVEMIQSRIAKTSRRDHMQVSEAIIPAYSTGHSLDIGNYIVTVGIGAPKKDFSLIIDTGSDLTLIQCQRCVKSCYTQETIFNPSQSSSYSNITCNTDECSELELATGNSVGCISSSTCKYGIQYNQSYSVGSFARETLTLTSSDVFHDFKFGCHQNNSGLFGNAAGLLGLGRNKISSMISQTSKKYGGIFSYCLPATSSSAGYLAFGHEAASTISSQVKFTPLILNSDHPSLYFLDLQAISVDGQELQISPSVFSTSGTIIDSGTVITRLPPEAYSKLRSAFQGSMSGYPKTNALSILDTCYDLTGSKTIIIPNITLHFNGGVAVEIDGSGITYSESQEQVCLAFAGNSDKNDITILGSKQQQNLDVIYDVAGAKLGFGPGGCK